MNVNQDNIDGYETSLDGLIETHKTGDYNSSVPLAIRREFIRYHTIIKNDSDVVAPNFLKISNYVFKNGLLK